MVESATDNQDRQMKLLRDACPNLEEPLLEEILDTFENYAANEFDESEEEDVEEKMGQIQLDDAEARVTTKDFKVLVSMLMSLGCDASLEKALELYERVTGRKGVVDMTLREFALIINKFIDEECDPVDGVIEAIADKYDPESSGRCKYTELIEFMKQNNWLEADPEAVEKVLSEFIKDKGGHIDYVKALKKLIQD